ncbi:MAG: hypothetical protein PHR66_12005 [Desulfuromonadaceae bacterium]|nr:hypothetical protein [Desulfuromonadaceae bacterium]
MKLLALRYFIIRNPDSILSSSEISPLDAILEVFHDRTTITYYNKTYYAIVTSKKEDKIWIGFLLRSTQTDVIFPEKNEFEKQTIPNWEESFLAIDTVNQSILVQNIASSFTPDLVKNVINKLLETKARAYDISAKVELICNNESFWTTFNKATKRYKIAFTLNAPNLFGARKATNDYLKEVKAITNMDTLQSAIENQEGKLSVSKELLEDIVKYADDGGGNWSQTTEENGKKKTTTSNQAAVKENADIDIDTPKQLKEQHKYVLTIVKGIFTKFAVKDE